MNKKSENLFSCAYYMIKNKNKSFEFVNQNYGYVKVIIKFVNEFLVIYDFNNDDVCYIELTNIIKVAINESRLIVIIYFQYETDFYKIILYNQQLYDEEFDLFKPIYVYLIEANR